MDETDVMLLLLGLAVGLMIAVGALVAVGSRTPPPVVVVQPPPPSGNDLGCGGFLMVLILMLMGLIFWVLVLT